MAKPNEPKTQLVILLLFEVSHPIYITGYTLCFDNVNLITITRHQTKTALRNIYNLVQVWHIQIQNLKCYICRTQSQLNYLFI